MNTKTLIPIVLLIMALMTGVAVAHSAKVSIEVTNDPIIINIGEAKTQVVSIVSDPTLPVSQLRIVNVPYGISVKINGTPFTPAAGTITKPLTGFTDQSFGVEFTNDDASNGDYIIEYQVDYKTKSGDYTSPRTAKIQAGIVPIPEFPTIALPIAAILGLMFIISSRKKKE